MNEWKIKEQQEKIDELERLLSEKESILTSEISMNTFLKTQNEQLKILLDTLAQLNKKFVDKLARERVLFKDRLNKL
tara:strand:- start:228 stop:458 length:231 start_codon:yes stop_codon:yes gene_type:complete